MPVEAQDLIAFDESVNRQLRQIAGKGDYINPDEEMLLRVYPMLGGALSSDEVKAAYRQVRRAEFDELHKDTSN